VNQRNGAIRLFKYARFIPVRITAGPEPGQSGSRQKGWPKKKIRKKSIGRSKFNLSPRKLTDPSGGVGCRSAGATHRERCVVTSRRSSVFKFKTNQLNRIYKQSSDK
jgi:hypothetical protein